MADPFNPAHYTDQAHQAHIERADERLRDRTELDNLKADIRVQGKREVTMPWRVGRPLRSPGLAHETGPNEGYPVTPLDQLNLHQAAKPQEADSLAREFARVELHDRISEGILDHAQALGVPLVSEEQWWEAEDREERHRAEQAASNPAPQSEKEP